MKAVIGEYADFYSEWWGLPDGTILPTNDARGCYWKKFGAGAPTQVPPPWESETE